MQLATVLSHSSRRPTLTLRGVRVRNLQGIDVDFPVHALVVITGVSGAGKTSLALETLAAEAQRRYLETFPVSARRFLERLERPDCDEIGPLPPAIILRRSHSRPGRRSTAATVSEIMQPLQQLYAAAGEIICPECHVPVVAHSAISIAALIEGWPDGIRFQIGFRRDLQTQEIADVVASELMELGFQRTIVGHQICTLKVPLPADWPTERNWIVIADRLQSGKLTAERLNDSLELALQHGGGSCELIVHDALQESGTAFILDGTECRRLTFHTRLQCGGCGRLFPTLSARLFSFHSPQGACPECRGGGEVGDRVCPQCLGARLNSDALAVHVAGMNLGQFNALTIDQAAAKCHQWTSQTPEIARGARWVRQLLERLELMQRLGLGYLGLNRAGRTLSSGEVQRLSLAATCSVRLVDAMYVLDEPAAGLHLFEVESLVQILKELRARGNSIIVVEHSATVVRAADAVIDLGPGAGPDGGRLIFQGSPNDLARCHESQTGNFLSGKIQLQRRQRREPSGILCLRGVTHRCLHNVDIDIPLGTLCVIAGPSGSGKSTLIADTLYPALCSCLSQATPSGDIGTILQMTGHEQLQAVVYVDQSPPEKSGRSNVATSTGLWAEVRALLASTPEAKIRQFTAGTFSFHNSRGGRCPTCEGMGVLAVDLQFLADLQVTCPDCHGTRFQRDVLEVKYRGLNVAEVLKLTVGQALPYFRGRSRLQRRLKALKDVGLGYVELGQPVSTMSGGETQRLQLATQMTGRPVGATLYLLDEPARGLHPADIQGLLTWFDDLLSAGHSLVVIEHRPEFIAVADHVIDLSKPETFTV